MKRFLLWVVGVILGVAVLLGAVMTVSYSFTGEGSRPAADTQFGGQALEVNGSCWQVPLLGGVFDKVFTSPETLTVQKLGVLYDAHPALALPDWASYTTLTIETDIGSIVFAGSASQYEDFLFPANGDYKAKLTVWRLPQDYLATQFEGGSTGAIRKNLGVEHPAKPTGWYSYSFRFTLQASAEVALSTERLEQGGVAALSITGLTGETAPAVETDLGSVQCVRLGSGWRAYIPAAYNASAGGHTVNVTVNGETFARTLTVLPKDFGTVEVEPEPASTEAANTEFRNNIWPLYEQPVREKLWAGAFLCPAENYMTLVDFGQVKVTGGQQGSRSNSTRLYTIPGEPCRAPANGVVVFAGDLALTGNTVVIEEMLTGPECSLLAFTDGKTVRPMATSQDHKRALEGDKGPNTGGMGVYSPVPIVTDEEHATMVAVMEQTVAELAAEGIDYRGCLYGGFMLTPAGPKVLEFNARFGDPETQVVLPRLKNDLVEVMLACANCELDQIELDWRDEWAVAVVLTSAGYPGSYEKGKVITGIEDVEAMENVTVYHAGTAVVDGQLVTNGGRVLAVTALGDTFENARNLAYEACEKIDFEGKTLRHDIGLRALRGRDAWDA